MGRVRGSSSTHVGRTQSAYTEIQVYEVLEEKTMRSGEAEQHSAGSDAGLSVHPGEHKRVSRACDPCRRKRASTGPGAGQRPCMNCCLYRTTCTDSPPVASRTQRAKRGQQLASLAARDESRRARSQGKETPVERGRASPQASRQTPPVASLEDVPHDHDLEAAPELPPDVQGQLSGTGGLVSSSDPWDSNLYMPNVFDFVSSSNISDLTDSMLGEFPQFNTMFPDSNERLPAQGTSEEADRGARPLSSTIRQPRVAGVHFLKDGLPSTKSASLLPGLFLRKDLCESRYQGLNSIGGTLSSCLIYAKNHSPELGENSLLRYLIQGITYMDEANMYPAPQIEPQDLPDRAFVEHGVESFFKNVYLRYPIVSLELRHSWTQWYEDCRSPPDPIQFLCICLMVAIGAIAHPNAPTEETQDQISALHQRAWSRMDYVLAYPYTGSVQVLLLHTLYFTQQGKLGIAWSTCGTALRVAESIGLHRHTPSDLQLSDDLVRLRARLWWIGFSLDAFLSLSEGRPTATSSDRTDTRIEPLALQECPYDCELPPSTTIYTWHVTLACLVNQIADIIGREKAANERLYCLADLDSQLIAWRDAIPLDFRPEQENIAPILLRHHVAWLHVQFFNVMRTLHWTSILLCHGDETGLTEKCRRLQYSEAICVASARSLIRTSNSQSVASDTREIRMLGAPSAYFLAATSTIFMYILKEPQRLSATADVEYLRAGIHHLQSDYFAAQVGQGEEILTQMLQVAEVVTDHLKSISQLR
ncbi:hypothetical protein FE257_005766 [Aspergillus nanangensis]|uniref:Xylanolytic transcriptional activator regulatory domain-containing protein n=1 Tax=Aspergillus nanangensis TaxID=2582783 RepID=A0AAD4GVG2_ASPNN|nr:hypothetical protein FE257_005766 [Aspergillus nanangensis]